MGEEESGVDDCGVDQAGCVEVVFEAVTDEGRFWREN